MASTSASCIPLRKSFKYEVFISFRGEDTRKNFVDNLYHALKQKGVYTYKDDEEIKKGKKISDELIKSIESSKIFIIVFSKNYTSSSWCLDELVKIMECHKKTTNEHTVYPIFYDVEPTEVRNQSGTVGEALLKHVNEEAAQRWRDALKEAAGLAGRELKNTFDGHQAKFIKKLVEEVSLELRFCNPSVDEDLIGMETRVKDVVSSLEVDVDDVRFIGIKGMGGAGKTTLARAVFDQISFLYEGSSFVKNVRETSGQSVLGLESLQKKILSDVSNDPNIIVKGDSDLKRLLRGRKVLVVLDDVDHINQLEALAGKPSWFKPGSRIIITTRDEQVLVAHKVPKNLILDVNLLSYEEATCLFNKYAFGRVISNEGYIELSNQAVHYASGLPLTLKVLGSSLCGKDELEWKDALERLETIPLKDTLEILELSYTSLEEDYKEIFLDVACILKGWKKEKAIRALECRGFHARSGLRVLEQKSLISVSEIDHGRLGMHDHIEEMGKNIVRRLHPDNPSRHSRLWNQDEIEDILVEFKGTEDTRCINAQYLRIPKDLRKMKELRFLYVVDEYAFAGRVDINDVDLEPIDIGEDSLYLPNSLQYLRWDDFPYKYLPGNFQANNLVGLDLRYAKIYQIWEEKERKVLKKLRFIHLVNCHKLRSLDIGLIPNLERLSLFSCSQLEELHIPVQTSKLRFIEMIYCNFRSLDVGLIPNLERLSLEDCYNLKEFHIPVNHSNLRYFNLCNCEMIRCLDIRLIPNLETLSLVKCSQLEELHIPVQTSKLRFIDISHCKIFRSLDIGLIPNLERLSLEECYNLKEFHIPVNHSNLRYLNLCKCEMIRCLDIRLIPNLETLRLVKCYKLEELHILVQTSKLRFIDISHCKIFRSLDIGLIPNLERLSLEECYNLKEFHIPVNHSNLRYLNLLNCALKILDLEKAMNLVTLAVEDHKYLTDLRMPVESLNLKHLILSSSMLKTIDITRYQNLVVSYLKCYGLVELHLPVEKLRDLLLEGSEMKTLNLERNRNLKALRVLNCKDLLQLHMPNESPMLETINISCSKLKTLNLTGTWSLKRLKLEECKDLGELHMPIKSPKLETINIHCPRLKSLNLTSCQNLETLDLEECKDLEKLHTPIESPNLETVNICYSKLRTLYLGMSPCLEQFDLHDCFTLEEIICPVGCLSGHVRFKPFVVNQGFPRVGSLAELHLIVRSIGTCLLHPEHLDLRFECIYKDLLPSYTDNLKKLITFNLRACTNLADLSQRICGLQRLRKLTLEGSIPEVPKELDQLECLEVLALLSTKIEHLPDNICMLKHLRLLRLKSCWSLKQLPDNIGKLECLEELDLTDCTSLQYIPSSICEIKHLKYFYLTNCILVEKLPKEIGLLECLKELNIRGTGISDPPDIIFQLENLKVIL